MYYSFEDLPKEYKVKGQRLWAFDYANNNTEKSKSLKSEPYLCEFQYSWRVDEFITSADYCYKVKNNGEMSTSSVRCGSRHYALTKEEAVEGYNELVMDTVMFLMKLAKRYEKDMIEVNNE